MVHTIFPCLWLCLGVPSLPPLLSLCCLSPPSPPPPAAPSQPMLTTPGMEMLPAQHLLLASLASPQQVLSPRNGKGIVGRKVPEPWLCANRSLGSLRRKGRKGGEEVRGRMGHVGQQEAVCGKQCDLISHIVALDNPELPLLSLAPAMASMLAQEAFLRSSCSGV